MVQGLNQQMSLLKSEALPIELTRVVSHRYLVVILLRSFWNRNLLIWDFKRRLIKSIVVILSRERGASVNVNIRLCIF